MNIKKFGEPKSDVTYFQWRAQLVHRQTEYKTSDKDMLTLLNSKAVGRAAEILIGARETHGTALTFQLALDALDHEYCSPTQRKAAKIALGGAKQWKDENLLKWCLRVKALVEQAYFDRPDRRQIYWEDQVVSGMTQESSTTSWALVNQRLGHTRMRPVIAELRQLMPISAEDEEAVTLCANQSIGVQGAKLAQLAQVEGKPSQTPTQQAVPEAIVVPGEDPYYNPEHNPENFEDNQAYYAGSAGQPEPVGKTQLTSQDWCDINAFLVDLEGVYLDLTEGREHVETDVVCEAYAANIPTGRHPGGPNKGGVLDKMARMVGGESKPLHQRFESSFSWAFRHWLKSRLEDIYNLIRFKVAGPRGNVGGNSGRGGRGGFRGRGGRGKGRGSSGGGNGSHERGTEVGKEGAGTEGHSRCVNCGKQRPNAPPCGQGVRHICRNCSNFPAVAKLASKSDTCLMCLHAVRNQAQLQVLRSVLAQQGNGR